MGRAFIEIKKDTKITNKKLNPLKSYDEDVAKKIKPYTTVPIKFVAEKMGVKTTTIRKMMDLNCLRIGEIISGNRHNKYNIYSDLLYRETGILYEEDQD